MPTTTIVLWNHEPVYESPARRTFSVNWEGELIRADVTIDVDPNPIYMLGVRGYVNRIVFNGTEVNWIGDPNNVITFDARPYLRKGANLIEIHHNIQLVFPGVQTAGAYAYLVVESSGPVGGEIAPPPSSGGGIEIPIPGFGGIPDWVVLIAIILLLLVILR